MAPVYELYAYDPNPVEGATAEVKVVYPALWGAIHLARALTSAGWEAKVTALEALPDGSWQEVALYPGPDFQFHSLLPTLGDA